MTWNAPCLIVSARKSVKMCFTTKSTPKCDLSDAYCPGPVACCFTSSLQAASESSLARSGLQQRSRLAAEHRSALACTGTSSSPCPVCYFRGAAMPHLLINDPASAFNQTLSLARARTHAHTHDSHGASHVTGTHTLTLAHDNHSPLTRPLDRWGRGSARRRVCHTCDGFAICSEGLTIREVGGGCWPRGGGGHSRKL